MIRKTRNRVRPAAFVLALCLSMGLLSGCDKKPGADAFGSIQARDPASAVQIVMASEIAPGGGTGPAYKSSAAWDDSDGVRHMYNALSEISVDGQADPEITGSEAWSGPDKIYLDVNGTGWQEREPGTGADRPAALDLDAAISLIGRLPKLYESAEAEPVTADMRAGLAEAYAFDAKFSDVRRLAGGASDGLEFDAARITCGFGEAGLAFVRAEASGDGGSFLVDIDIVQWNVPGMALEIPGDVTGQGSGGGFEFDVEKPGGGLSVTYAMESDIPEEFQGGELASIAKGIEAGGAGFDRIQVAALDGFDELQYHTHGELDVGTWQAVLSVEKHPDGTSASARQAELQAFNDLWYDGRPGASGGWLCWSGTGRDGNAVLELARTDGDMLYLLQASALNAPDVGPAGLAACAETLIAGIGQQVSISFDT